MEEEVCIEGSAGAPYMVEKIVGIYIGKDRKKFYQVKWMDSWEPEELLSDSCKPLIDEFWSGNNFDSQGNVVKRTDVKLGQKIIKRELVSAIRNESVNKLPNKNPAIIKNELKANLLTAIAKSITGVQSNANPTLIPVMTSSNTQSSTQTTVVSSTSTVVSSSKRPSSVPILTTKSDTSSPTFNQRKSLESLSKLHGNDHLNQLTSFANELTTVAVSKSAVFAHNDPPKLLPCPSYSSVSLVSQSNPLTSSVTSTVKSSKRQTVKTNMTSTTTQTDDMAACQPYKDSNNVLYSSPPSRNSLDNDSDEEGEYFVDHYADCENTSNVEQFVDDDEMNGLQTDPNNVNIAEDTSDDELEITVSIESPHKQKRKNATSEGSSPSRRGRPPNSKEGQTVVRKISSNSRSYPNGILPQNALHPRRFLNHLNELPAPQSIQLSNNQNNLNATHQNNSNYMAKVTERPTSVVSTNSSSNIQPGVVLRDRTCSICLQTFDNLTLARQHVKLNHNKNTLSSPSFKCNICNATFVSKQACNAHSAVHKNNTTHSNGSHKCKTCSKMFKRKHELNQHMLVHRDEFPHSCDICNLRFRQQGHLITHKGRKHADNEGSYSCNQCGMGFTSYTRFSIHMRQHDALLPFKCNICNERFVRKNELLIHLEHHNNGPCFTCHICKKSFKTKSYLFGHMQMHQKQTLTTSQNLATATTSQASFPSAVSEGTSPRKSTQNVTNRNMSYQSNNPISTKIKMQDS